MGAWSHEPFGNDDANDWAYGLEKSKDLGPIESALDKVLESEGYLEASEASEAVGAVEVIAKLLGRGTQTDAYTEKIDEWVNTVGLKPSSSLLAKASRTLDRILSDDSELRELWQEEGTGDWENSIANLKKAIDA
jgi:hypothetical protein